MNNNPIKTNSLKTAQQKHKLKRTASFKSVQQKTASCFAFASARLILKFITKFLKEDFTLSEQDKELLYKKDLENDNYKENIYEPGVRMNCFFNHEIMDIPKIKTKCIVKPRYNYALVFYFVFKHIVRVFGCDGGNSYAVLTMFKNNGNKLFMLNEKVTDSNSVLSKELDIEAGDFIIKYYKFIEANKINVYVNYSTEEPLSQTKTQNWITNFSKGAQKAIKDDLYVIIEFSLPEKQFDEFGSDPFKQEKTTLEPSDITDIIDGHSVVITDWDGESATILNSWGQEWGENGYIVIPSNYFFKVFDTSSLVDGEGWMPFLKKMFMEEIPIGRNLRITYLSYDSSSSFMNPLRNWWYGNHSNDRRMSAEDYEEYEKCFDYDYDLSRWVPKPESNIRWDEKSRKCIQTGGRIKTKNQKQKTLKRKTRKQK
jgi:hypothetical protein